MINRHHNDTQEQRISYFQSLTLDDCFNRMRAMHVYYHYDDYVKLLMNEADLKVIAEQIIAEFQLNKRKMNYEFGGLHTDLVIVMLEKIKATMDISAADYYWLMIKCKHIIKEKVFNLEHYNNCMALANKLLLIISYYDMNHSYDLDHLLECDSKAFFNHLLKVANEQLKTMTFKDVLVYENMMNDVLTYLNDYAEEVIITYRLQLYDLYKYFKHDDEAQYDLKLIKLDYGNHEEILKRVKL